MQLLKRIRVLLSIIFFIVFSALFLDPYHTIPSSFITFFTAFQLGPSLLKVFSDVSLTTVIAILLLILTLMVGRVYCSTLCPLGTLQDFFSRLPQYFNRKLKRRFRYTKHHSTFHYFLFIIICLSAMSGGIILLNIFEPYSNFGRMSSTLGTPIIVFINNFIAKGLTKLNIFDISQLSLRRVDWLPTFYAIIFLIFLAVLSFKKGRIFCNLLCPVGAFLSILSRFSIYRISIVPEACTRCSLCEKICKAECIKTETKQLDVAACISCFNCIGVCPKDGFRYRAIWEENKNTEQQTTDNSRRMFLHSAAFVPLVASLPAIEVDTSKQIKNRYYEIKKNAISPPGSESVLRFTELCTACHLCISLCPSQVLYPATFEYGLSGILQPRMDYSANYCNYNCVLCSQVCPTGAIRNIEPDAKKEVQIGKVEFYKNDCIVITKRKDCGACSEHCPTKAVRMVPYENLFLPEINTEICVGCGACEHACPVVPQKAIYVVSNYIHGKAKKPIQEIVPQKDQQQLQDFPF